MNYEYDPSKEALNLDKHKLSLTLAEGFDWDTAQIEEDRSEHYDEQRFRATGYIGLRLYRLIFCIRDDVTRLISLRPATKREYRDYART